MPLLSQAATPRVILGLMTFGPDEAKGARIKDPAEFARCLDLLQSRGYNEIDTARTYVGGKQEAFTREAKWKERGFTLATKVHYPDHPGDNSRDKVMQSVETSLAELGTDCVDILYLHAADRATPFAETLEAVNELHKAGKFVRLGLSNFTAFEVAEVVMTCKHNGWVRPSIYQGMYNMITRGLEAELMPACRRYGLDVVVYNPIAGGLFSGKIKSADMVPADGRFSDTTDSIGKLYRGRYFRPSSFDALRLVEDAVAQEGLSVIEAALRWTVHHSALRMGDGGRDGVIIGVSSLKQLDENLTHLEKGPLPAGLARKLDEAWAVTKADAPNYWHLDLSYAYDTREAVFGKTSS